MLSFSFHVQINSVELVCVPACTFDEVVPFLIFLAGRGGGGGYRGGYQDYGPPAYVEGKPSQVWSELHVQLLQAIHTQTWYVGAKNYGKCWGWLGSNRTSLDFFCVWFEKFRLLPWVEGHGYIEVKLKTNKKTKTKFKRERKAVNFNVTTNTSSFLYYTKIHC